MKKIIVIALSVLVSLTSYAQVQTENTLKFLGIPVDGKKTEVRDALIEKGFKWNREYDTFTGIFNGRESIIGISENNGKVYRIGVFDFDRLDEGQIKIRYNNLINQFKKSEKYIPTPGVINENEITEELLAKYIIGANIYNSFMFIPEDENISYKMTVKGKTYQQVYLYNSFYLLNDKVKNEILEGAKKHENENFPGTDISYEDYVSNNIQCFVSLFWLKNGLASNYYVWFQIFKDDGGYYIGIIYENMMNAPNGEDL